MGEGKGGEDIVQTALLSRSTNGCESMQVEERGAERFAEKRSEFGVFY